MLVRFISAEPQRELPAFFFFFFLVELLNQVPTGQRALGLNQAGCDQAEAGQLPAAMQVWPSETNYG